MSDDVTDDAVAEPDDGTNDDAVAVREERGTTHQRRTAGARELLRSRRWRSGALIGVLCALLGFAFVTQVHSNSRSSSLSTARQGDLVQILDDLSSKQQRLDTEIAQLQQTRDQLASGDSSAAAQTDAQRRAAELGVLAGTVPAYGPGLIIKVSQGSAHLPAEVLLDAVEELRGAGAEALQVTGSNGRAVRIVAASYLVDNGTGITVDGTTLSAPYTFSVIGSSSTMAAALDIPGGVTDTISAAGGHLVVTPGDRITVSALRRVQSPQYARPTS